MNNHITLNKMFHKSDILMDLSLEMTCMPNYKKYAKILKKISAK